jgi:hypothetical protein
MSRSKNYGSPSPGAVILMSNSRYLSLTLRHELPNHEDDECDYGDRNDNTGPHTRLKNVADNITAGH